MIIMSSELPEVESIAGAPGVLPTPFAMHGLASPLAGPYNGVPPAGGLAGLGGFPLGAAGLGVRVQGSAQASAVLLVSNLNEEVSTARLQALVPIPFPVDASSPSTRGRTKIWLGVLEENLENLSCFFFRSHRLLAIKDFLADYHDAGRRFLVSHTRKFSSFITLPSTGIALEDSTERRIRLILRFDLPG